MSLHIRENCFVLERGRNLRCMLRCVDGPRLRLDTHDIVATRIVNKHAIHSVNIRMANIKIMFKLLSQNLVNVISRLVSTTLYGNTNLARCIFATMTPNCLDSDQFIGPSCVVRSVHCILVKWYRIHIVNAGSQVRCPDVNNCILVQ